MARVPGVAGRRISGQEAVGYGPALWAGDAILIEDVGTAPRSLTGASSLPGFTDWRIDWAGCAAAWCAVQHTSEPETRSLPAVDIDCGVVG
jgi:hypothetical protein